MCPVDLCIRLDLFVTDHTDQLIDDLIQEKFPESVTKRVTNRRSQCINNEASICEAFQDLCRRSAIDHSQQSMKIVKHTAFQRHPDRFQLPCQLRHFGDVTILLKVLRQLRHSFQQVCAFFVRISIGQHLFQRLNRFRQHRQSSVQLPSVIYAFEKSHTSGL